jgi:DNA-binding GntR family transcriptional regulator
MMRQLTFEYSASTLSALGSAGCVPGARATWVFIDVSGVMSMNGRPHSSECAINEHRDLIKALREGDADKAVALMHEHLLGIESRALLPAPDDTEDRLARILAPYARAAG